MAPCCRFHRRRLSESVAKPRLQDSTMKWPAQPQRLPKDAPNILIILLDDIGFGVAETFGGEVHTPTLTKLANEGLRYNAFHTTAICSPTRAALLTGRNHTRVGSGTIAERAVAFDGYTGVIPKEAATVAEVLRHYGYVTSAFGKWHNTPATETTSMGPKDRWPNGYGFDYFYGFLAGETSQWEPRLVENYNTVEPPHDDPKYHLTEDMVNKALAWIDDRQSFAPDRPFLMYWAPGAAHGPHHIWPEWADKYKGKFDDGWDAYRERVHKRQLEMGIIPPGTKLTPRDADDGRLGRHPGKPARLPAPRDGTLRRLRRTHGRAGRPHRGRIGTARPAREHAHPLHRGRQRLQLRRPAGFHQRTLGAEQHSQHRGPAACRAGKTRRPARARLAQDRQHVSRRLGLGRLARRFKSTKLVAAHFGGTRNPLVVSWPKRIKPDKTVRSQFTHCVDIAPTIYDLLEYHAAEIRERSRADARSTATASPPRSTTPTRPRPTPSSSSTTTAAAPFTRTAGWPAPSGRSIPGTRPLRCPASPSGTPPPTSGNSTTSRTTSRRRTTSPPRIRTNSRNSRKEFLALAEDNQAFPIGAGNWLRLRPQDRVSTPYRSWTFNANTRRMPEFTAPGLGRESNMVEIDMECGDNASGVLYALGGSGGGLALYMDQGHLVYLYNMMIIEQYEARSAQPLAAGKHKIVVDTTIAGPGKEGTAVITVDGKEVGKAELKRTVPAAFTASESLDVGIDLGSTVSTDYYDRRPFKFDGKIASVRVELK